MTYLETLQQQCETMKLILDNSFGNIFAADNTGKIIYSNLGAASIMGLTPEQACKMSIYELRDKGYADDPAIIHVLEDHKELIQTVRYNTGESLAIDAKPVFNEKGQLTCVVAISHNYSMLERYMDSIRKKTKLYWEALDHIKHDDPLNKPMIGKSPAMKEMMQNLSRVEKLDTPILIYGELGTGKHAVANHIQRTSRRSNQIYLSFNCVGTNPEKAEEELFGKDYSEHKDFSDKPGLLEMANNGTLFLEEISALDLTLQAKLCDVLETNQFKRIGGTKFIHTDVRIIATTKRNLKAMVSRREFHPELYFKMNAFPITIPPLRERIEDIAELANNMLEELNTKYDDNKQIDRQALEVLRMYPWPGNVRELQNTLERLFAIVPKKYITAADVNSVLSYDSASNNQLLIAPPNSQSPSNGLKESLDEYQRLLIKNTLKKTNGNVTQAAKILKISRAGLYKKITELELREKPFWQ